MSNNKKQVIEGTASVEATVEKLNKIINKKQNNNIMKTSNSNSNKTMNNENNTTMDYGIVATTSSATIQYTTSNKAEHVEFGITISTDNMTMEISYFRSGFTDIVETNCADGTTDRHGFMEHCMKQWYLKFVQNYPMLEQYNLNGDCRGLANEENSVLVSYKNGISKVLCISSIGELILRITYPDGRTEAITFPYWVAKPFYDKLYALITRLIAEEEAEMIEDGLIECHEDYEDFMEFCRDIYVWDEEHGYDFYEAWQDYIYGDMD